MTPNLSGGIDHVHVYVPSRRQAADWYAAHLGFHIVEELAVWTAEDSGPMTIADAADRIHFALFKSDTRKPVSLAFGATAPEYLAWRAHLQERQLLARETDHDLSFSMYFSDPFGNQIEITTYDHEAIRGTAS